MEHSRFLFRKRRGRDLCHLAFRQTLDLLRVTDGALADLCHECPRMPDLDGLVLRALNEMALGEKELGTLAPSHVFLAHAQGDRCAGKIYRLAEDGYRPVGDAVRLDLDAALPLRGDGEAPVVSNREDEDEPGSYAFRFDRQLREAIDEPIRNYIAHRIAGDRPGAIAAFNYPGGATRYEAQVLAAVAVTLGSLWTLASRMAQVEEAFIYLVGALARASEVNDEVTGDHILRVSRYAQTLAEALGFSENQARVVAYSSQLHDVGKIHIPPAILRKTGPLTAAEEEVIRHHPLQGERIIGTSPRLAVARKIAGAHHENWDGSGYPRGLAGEEIPREAQLVKVVDIYDALRCERPYKPAFSHEEACRILEEGDDRIDPRRHFDPVVLEAFFDLQETWRRIHAEIQSWS